MRKKCTWSRSHVLWPPLAVPMDKTSQNNRSSNSMVLVEEHLFNQRNQLPNRLNREPPLNLQLAFTITETLMLIKRLQST
mmetsp:Transcript_11725/g.28895  ORF Transcript_11725/g.28895 Transcript_11725/m.28895 type:complete len:80 (+) Transcript_11725:2238-2477(+)